ncbi:Methyltransferase domain [Popillia japonica]|uniref:RNA methyltransferase n=1 Tax=Popillia japonica TaxID=7064 RepID=A0AAW1KG62_POPJA
MSSAVMEHPVKMQQTKSRRTSNFSTTTTQKKFKHDRSSRKRSKSFSGGGPCKIKSMKPVLPTKFLLGGNINDPLNLNSLQDEEINRAMNAVTPKSSPIPTPPRRKGQIEVIIPSNLQDPLHLIDCADDAEFEQQLCSPVKKGRKKRLRKKRTMSATLCTSDTDMSGMSEAKTPESHSDSAKIPDTTETTDAAVPKVKELSLELSPKKDKNKRKSDEHKENVKKMKYSMDKIVSPVIPQPGAWLKRTSSHNGNRHHRPNRAQPSLDSNQVLPKFKEKNKQYQYGNYNRYYGYRNANNDVDSRLRCFSYHTDLFEGKDILDIGCNIGHITLSVARDFGAKTVVGLDIDKNLISIARKNIKHYVSSESPRDDDCTTVKQVKDRAVMKSRFSDKRKGHKFPYNVTFVQGNYVLDDESLLNLEQPQFDVILCLSVTKWIHLNWGDNGLKQTFRRMYAQLRPGGRLILEPQNWASYKSKKKLTETIYKNYHSIEFFPEKFTQYLLSPEIGFAKSEYLGFPHHQSKGFQRPIQVYTKSTMFPSERIEGPLATNDVETKVYAPVSTPDENSTQDFSPAVNSDSALCDTQAVKQNHLAADKT